MRDSQKDMVQCCVLSFTLWSKSLSGSIIPAKHPNICREWEPEWNLNRELDGNLDGNLNGNLNRHLAGNQDGNLNGTRMGT